MSAEKIPVLTKEEQAGSEVIAYYYFVCVLGGTIAVYLMWKCYTNSIEEDLGTKKTDSRLERERNEQEQQRSPQTRQISQTP